MRSPNPTPTLADVQCVNVVGTSGCGKSTFAKQLAQLTGAQHIELDRLHWLPNWVEEDNDRFREKLQTAIEQTSSSVIDGNYHSKSADIKWNHVTSIVWVDPSFFRTFYQAITRAVSRIWTRKELWPETGNRESFRRTFLSHDSIIWWTIVTFRNNRRRYLELMNDPVVKHVRFFRLRHRRDIKHFFEALKKELDDS